MSTPTFSADDFTAALQALMPPGRAWPRDPDATQTALLAALAQGYARHAARSFNLLVDANPATTVELLSEWESTLGLPDDCAGESPTLQQRRAQVVARLASVGGQSADYFVGIADSLGYKTYVQQFAPFRAGQSSAGQQLGGAEWFYVWAINAPLESASVFRAGRSAAGEPLAAWGNAVLECEFANLKPAHTVLRFQYSAELQTVIEDLDTLLTAQDVLDRVINTDLPASLG